MNEANKAAAAKFLATVGSGDVEGFKSVVTTDLIVTTAGYAKISGVRNYEQMIGLTSAFPQITKSGLSFEVLHMTAEDDRVACEAQGFSEQSMAWPTTTSITSCFSSAMEKYSN